MTKVNWTPKYRFWQKAHGIVNRIAWKLDPHDKHVDYPRSWIWRFNDWVAGHYVGWLVEQVIGRKIKR